MISSAVDISLACKHVFWFSSVHFCILDICRDLSWDFQKSLTCLLASPSARSLFHGALCICTLSYPPFQLAHEHLFHSLAPLQTSPEIGMITTTNARPAGGGLCSVHCGLLHCPPIMDPSYGYIVLKIQALLLRIWTFHVPLPSQAPQLGFSPILLLRIPPPKMPYLNHFTSYCAYRNREYYTMPRHRGWGVASLLANNLNIAALGPHLRFSKMSRPHSLDLQNCSGIVKAQMFV